MEEKKSTPTSHPHISIVSKRKKQKIKKLITFLSKLVVRRQGRGRIQTNLTSVSKDELKATWKSCVFLPC